MINLTRERGGILDRVWDKVGEVLGGVCEEAWLALDEQGWNRSGGTLTLRGGRIWTGDPARPWAKSVVIRNGFIAGLDGTTTEGRVIDLEGRLVVPGFQDNHCHPQTPFVLFSPQAPMLFACTTLDEVLEEVRRYVAATGADRYPRFFGWMSPIFPPGVRPTRQMLDAVVADRPCYLVHHSGHEFWANTKALELADVLHRDPPGLPRSCVIHRDPATGLATGYTEESEFANTDGVLLRSVRKDPPLTLPMQALALRYVLEEFSRQGVTAIWTKDGDFSVIDVYEKLLRHDSLPVRTILDVCHTPFGALNDIDRQVDRAARLRMAGLPPGFLRADGAKLLIDMPTDTHQAWLFEPYADGIGGCGFPVFDADVRWEQARRADLLGLTLNFLAIGDRAVDEALGLLERVARENPPRRRRHCVEHAEFVRDVDVPRFRQIDAVPIFNWIGAYPNQAYQEKFAKIMGEERISALYQRWRDLIAAGSPAANGSDFPLAPPDPLAGMHVMVTGKNLEGEPSGGLWPHKHLSIEQALRTYTTHGAYARGEELHSGRVRLGYDADLTVLAEDILADGFDANRLGHVKVSATIVNGHVVYEDFSSKPKTFPPHPRG